MKPEPQAQPTEAKPRKKNNRRWPGWVSGGLLALLAILYSLRPDITTAITVWPAWVGLCFGLGFVLLALRPRRWMVALWLIFGFVFVEEFRSIPRGLMPAAKADFRVVSLNCAGGSIDAAREVKALNPDLVLFQESPSRPELEKLAREWFGEGAVIAAGPDATILARGKLTPYPRPLRVANFVAARWEPAPGRALDVVSLRLAPPLLRIDLYNPAAWRDFAANRTSRQAEMAEMKRRLTEMGVSPDVLGGDFNTPPDSAIQAALVGGKADAFATAGVGFGATCVNPYPNIVRIDQIWTTSKVECTRSFTVSPTHSDHRILVADFRWR